MTMLNDLVIKYCIVVSIVTIIVVIPDINTITAAVVVQDVFVMISKLTGAIPEAKRILEEGQCAMPTPSVAHW